jgi:nucleolin
MAYATTEDTLRQFFGSCGDISAIRIAMDPQGYPKGFCHIDFDSVEGATSAVGLSGQNLDNRAIHIEFAQERGAQNTPQSGGRGGNW